MMAHRRSRGKSGGHTTKPPLPAAPPRWTTLTHSATPIPGAIEIIITTDIANVLTLAYTETYPGIHGRNITRLGVVREHHNSYSLHNVRLLPQTEGGPSLTHHFELPLLLDCHTIYYAAFDGTDPLHFNSISPIFAFEYCTQPPAYPIPDSIFPVDFTFPLYAVTPPWHIVQTIHPQQPGPFFNDTFHVMLIFNGPDNGTPWPANPRNTTDTWTQVLSHLIPSTFVGPNLVEVFVCSLPVGQTLQNFDIDISGLPAVPTLINIIRIDDQDPTLGIEGAVLSTYDAVGLADPEGQLWRSRFLTADRTGSIPFVARSGPIPPPFITSFADLTRHWRHHA